MGACEYIKEQFEEGLRMSLKGLQKGCKMKAEVCDKHSAMTVMCLDCNARPGGFFKKPKGKRAEA
jgi:hypothetical protein